MRIGVTGATGLIGEAFAKLAVASGHEVIGYSRRAAPLRGLTQTLQQPASSPHALPETQLDALVHLAGESLLGFWTASKRRRITESRIAYTQRLVSHLQTWKPENRPRVFLSASGIGYYGNRGDTELDESSPRGTGFLSDLCHGWEQAAASLADTRVVHLRTSMVLSRQGGAYPLMRRAFRLGLGGNLGSGRQWMSWIHLDDQVALMLWAIESEAVSGPLNLCAPKPELNSNFTRKLAQHLHRPACLHAPAFALRLLLRDLADEMLLTSQRGLPTTATQLGYRFAYPRLEDALVALG